MNFEFIQKECMERKVAPFTFKVTTQREGQNDQEMHGNCAQVIDPQTNRAVWTSALHILEREFYGYPRQEKVFFGPEKIYIEKNLEQEIERRFHYKSEDRIVTFPSHHKKGIPVAQYWDLTKPIYIAGYPLDRGFRCIQGTIAIPADPDNNMQRQLGGNVHIITEAVACPVTRKGTWGGVSGSIVINTKGEAVGVLSGGSIFHPHYCYCLNLVQFFRPDSGEPDHVGLSSFPVPDTLMPKNLSLQTYRSLDHYFR